MDSGGSKMKNEAAVIVISAAASSNSEYVDGIMKQKHFPSKDRGLLCANKLRIT